MRILDEQNQELSQEDVDLSLGYLKDEKLFIKKESMKAHYKVNCFVFTDGTSYTPESEDDPHIKVVDANKGQFEYIPDEGDERTVKGAAIGLVVDKEPEDIYEDIKRYIRYRTDELELHKLPSRMEGAEESIVETQEGLEEANINIEDLILLMAEILGGEEEPEEEPEDEPINPDEPIDPDEPVDPDEPIIPDEPIDPEPEPTEDPVDPNDESESEPIEESTEEPVEESTEPDNNSVESIEEPVDPIENSEN